MFDDEALLRLDSTTYAQLVPVRSWNLSLADDRSAWRRRGGEGVTATERGYALVARSRKPGSKVRFVASARVDADEADAILVAFDGKRSPTLRLEWAAKGEPCRRGGLKQLPIPALAEGPIIVRFFLADDPEWTGEIDRICLSVLSNSTQVVLQSVALVEERFDLEDSEFVDSVVRGRLASETRPSFVGVAGSPRAWDVDVVADARLEFGFGTTTRGRASISVTAVTSRDHETIFAAQVGPGEALSSNQWHSGSVDLGAWAGQSLSLQFKVEAPPGNRGFALWSEPTLLAPQEGPVELPNLVVVSLDTLRPDHLSLYGYERQTSPRIDSWAQKATLFEHAVTTAPWTLPAHLSLFTGLDALSHGVNHKASLPESLEVLASRLRELGYQTLAATGGGYMHADVGFDRGFDRYRFWANRKDSDDELHDTVSTVLDWIDEVADRPFFLFVHTYEIHHPYLFREPYFSEFFGAKPPPHTSLSYVSNGNEVESSTLLSKWPTIKVASERSEPLDDELLPMLVAAYDSGIAYTDREVGKLFERLEQPQLAARTATVLTSDHGEALGEKGLAGHLYLKEFNARIPLVIRLPGLDREASRVGEQVGIIDLYPTLLELAGEAVEPGSIDGRSILGLALGHPAGESVPAWTYAGLSRRGLAMSLDGRWKYMLNNSAAAELLGHEALYDLKTDPGETDDRAASHLRTREFRRLALAHLAQRMTGLRLRLRNPTGDSLTFDLTGVDANLVRTKAATLHPEWIEWPDRQRMRVTLPDGGETVLFFENASQRRINLRCGSTAVQSFDLRLDNVDLPARLVWREQRLWLSDGGGTVVVNADWIGPGGSSEERINSAEIEAQLRALGYLD